MPPYTSGRHVLMVLEMHACFQVALWKCYSQKFSPSGTCVEMVRCRDIAIRLFFMCCASKSFHSLWRAIGKFLKKMNRSWHLSKDIDKCSVMKKYKLVELMSNMSKWCELHFHGHQIDIDSKRPILQRSHLFVIALTALTALIARVSTTLHAEARNKKHGP